MIWDLAFNDKSRVSHAISSYLSMLRLAIGSVKIIIVKGKIISLPSHHPPTVGWADSVCLKGQSRKIFDLGFEKKLKCTQDKSHEALMNSLIQKNGGKKTSWDCPFKI